MRTSAAIVLSMALAGCEYSQFGTAHTAPLTPLGPTEELSTGTYTMTLQGDEIVMPEQIEFDVNRATIRNTEQSQRVLSQLLMVLKARTNITKLRIEGHTDSTGGHAYNRKLSQARAESVATWLVEHQIDRARLTTAGLGDTKPVAGNETPAGRQQNRRTEFHVQEVDGKPSGGGTGAVSPSKSMAASSRGPTG
jgi:outer membrane protein OmpA-like peptidoglycan-associated protein